MEIVNITGIQKQRAHPNKNSKNLLVRGLSNIMVYNINQFTSKKMGLLEKLSLCTS
jgi:hypothetical protein